MIWINFRKSRWAKFLCIMLCFQFLLPLQFPLLSMALSGGPNPPEFSSFQSIGAGDLVDPFSGDVQYSLPILEVGGYPINLTYSGNINPEQDAGWVGLGWSLQAGSIGRAMRGLPDDFSGEKIKKEVNIKPRIYQEYQFQYHKKDAKSTELFSLKGGLVTMSFPTVTHDNYKGFGVKYEIKFSPKKNMLAELEEKMDVLMDSILHQKAPIDNEQLSEYLDKINIKNAAIKNGTDVQAKFDFTTDYNSYNGNSYALTPNIGSIKSVNEGYLTKSFKKMSLFLSSPTIQFNTHSGLQSVGLKTGIASTKKPNSITANFSHNFAAPSYLPRFSPDMASNVLNFALDLSSDKGFFNGRKISVKMKRSVEALESSHSEKRAYGYLYSELGQDVTDALTDHQSAPVIVNDRSEMLPPTVSAHDVFNISASGVGGSFKIKYNSLGMTSPPTANVKTGLKNPTVNVDFGNGTNVEIGGDLGATFVSKKVSKWEDNDLEGLVEFKSSEANNLFESYALRNNFEFIQSDQSFNNTLGGYDATKFSIHRKGKQTYKQRNMSAWNITNDLYNEQNQLVSTVSSSIEKIDREARQQLVTYLTATQASKYGVLKKIRNYKLEESIKNMNCDELGYIADLTEVDGKQTFEYEVIERTEIDGYREGHHISEINVLQPSGVLFNFGLPVYQIETKDISFSVSGSDNGKSLSNYLEGTTNYSATDDSKGNTKGIDNFYEETTTPAYATAFLLTNILSADYSDITNDGPTEDDLGTYVKFNYAMPDKVIHENNNFDDFFDWRSPSTGVNWNRGYKSDELDDRASFSYGKREQWNMHSIETKDRVVVFVTGDRADGLESANRAGGFEVNGEGNRQKYLQEIRIFSKKDFDANGLTAEPLRKIRFHYSYTLCKGIPNYSLVGVNPSCDNHPLGAQIDLYVGEKKYDGGKLTLNMVEFIEGTQKNSTKAPYVFEYNTENPDYKYKSTDRWGVYHSQDMYTKNLGSNKDETTLSDFPYTTQNEGLITDWASAWMLSDITLPSGGHISLEYESDDYAYVQNKKALSMKKIKGVRKSLDDSDSENLYEPVDKLGQLFESKLYVTFEKEATKTAQDYVPEDDLIYFSFNVNLARTNKLNMSPSNEEAAYEQVSGFFEIEESGDIDANTGYIKIKEYDLGPRSKNVHPVTKMGWQYSFSNLPHLMNPSGYTQRSSTKEKLADAAKQAIGIIPEWIKSITGEAVYFKSFGYAKEIDKSKSFLRLLTPNETKFGGGHRVKKVTVTDNWNSMTNSEESSSSYSTSYSYNTNGPNSASSGVASYEPFSGGDENPFKMPLLYDGLKSMYLGKRKAQVSGISVGYDLGPVGEQFYPSASVGYSKVSIESDAPNTNIVRHKAGRTEYEFYTSYDYPTKSSMTPLDRKKRVFNTPTLSKGLNNDTTSKSKKFKFGFDVAVSVGFAAASQGFVIEQNDMHGKPKSVKVFKDLGDVLVSSKVYHYKTDANGDLSNDVTVLKPDGTHETVEMGVQMDPTLYSYRITETVQDGTLQPDFNLNQPTPVPLPVFTLAAGYHLYANDGKVMILTKQIFRSGILDKVEVMDKGAHSFTKNHAWDPVTGKVLVTESLDEFNDEVFTLNKPAYWMNPALQGGYNNINLKVKFTKIASDFYDPSDGLTIGDVLIEESSTSQDKYWVLDKLVNANGSHVTLITKNGSSFSPDLNKTYRVLRSGHKNLLHYGAESVTLKTNPIDKTSGLWDQSYDKVISASAIDYNDKRHLLHKFEYCFRANCYSGFLPTDISELNSFGNEMENPPTSFSSIFNFDYETLESFDEDGREYQKPTYCCDVHSTEFGDGGGTTSPPPSLPTPPCDKCTPSNFSTNSPLNPFIYGLKGIWQPSSEIVYYEKRDNYVTRLQTETTAGNPNSTNIREAGYLQNYEPYWTYSASGWSKKSLQGVNNPWTWKDSITLTDFFGNSLESVSALNDINNCVLYDYNRELPVAVASNASYNEVVFDGFEDYSEDNYVELTCEDSLDGLSPNPPIYQDSWVDEICNSYRHWRVGESLLGGSNRISSKQSHTGSKSLMLGLGATNISVTSPPNYIDGGSYPKPIKTFYPKSADFISNFHLSPTVEQDYIISLWTKESIKDQFELNVYANGTQLTTSIENKSVIVNGWRKVSYRFTLSASSSLSSIEFVNKYRYNNGSFPKAMPCYVDDIVIHPVDAVVNAYVYDKLSKRLVAVLNPNNYATFYEYDNEGKLIRQKAETDRGIKTLGEVKQGYKY
jgi:hypothetical protein